jgi:hypothetical protein
VTVRRISTVAALALAAAFSSPLSGAAQAFHESVTDEALLFEDKRLDRAPQLDAPLVELANSAERYVVVHLAENRVFVFEGDHAIWSAPAGTGTGFQLVSGDHSWKFATPRGMMRIRRMEKDPLWEAPDWHYYEKGLKPPPAERPVAHDEGDHGDARPSISGTASPSTGRTSPSS